MKVYKKEGDSLEIIAYPGETVYKGEYLLVMDKGKDVGLIVQVTDLEYVDVPGLIEEIIREGLLRTSVYHGSTEEYDSISELINDLKILKCKIRSAIKDGVISNFIDDLPSRASSKVVKLPSDELLSKVFGRIRYPIEVGRDLTGNGVHIDAYDLDGSLTLITGMKGSGKSHLSKLLAKEIVELGGRFIIFDLNREYTGLGELDGVKLLEPGRDIIMSLRYLGKDTILSVMVNILGMPSVSANVLNDLWDKIVRMDENVKLASVSRILDADVRNQMVKEAILSRLTMLVGCRFIGYEGRFRFEDLFKDSSGYIINLRELSSIERRVLVEIFLSKLSRLLERRVIPPLFLFAEEAHLYIRDTYWEDIVTRMRHFGLFPIFITNQPDSLDQTIFRQLDNIFIFRFLNDRDLESLSKVSNVDSESIKYIVKDLERGKCLILGKVVKDFPVVVSTKELEFRVLGETRRIFN